MIHLKNERREHTPEARLFFGEESAMFKKVIVFLVCFGLAFGEGYLYLSADSKGKANGDEKARQAAQPAGAGETNTKVAADSSAGSAKVAADPAGDIFVKRNCISCHSVSALGVKGGQIGPDLSTIYDNMESKHGVKLEDFLKKPNSAVMAGVIGSNPLTDDELKAVIAALKTASEKTKAK
jgi:mono/diheme cytochrome c family protein